MEGDQSEPKPKRGRPAIGNPLAERLVIRCSAEDLELFNRAAGIDGYSNRSVWVLKLLRQTAKRLIAKSAESTAQAGKTDSPGEQ